MTGGFGAFALLSLCQEAQALLVPRSSMGRTCRARYRDVRVGRPRQHQGAAITSVSGLDPPPAARDDLGRPSTATLDPAFNLTLRIASRSRTYGACLDAGSWLDVSYRGVRLAAAPAPPRLCAGRMEAAETAAPVVAWGAAVHVPGFAMDSLAEEMRRGDAAFDVTLTVPSVQDHRQGKLVRCMARRVGDVVGALGTPCVVNYVDTAVAVPQPGA